MKTYTQKVFQDFFYQHTYKYLGMASLAPAGFLYDKNTSDKTLLEIEKDKNSLFNINLNKIIHKIENLTTQEKEKIKKR